MVKARKFVLVSYFNGFPKPENLQLVEENLSDISDGGGFYFLEFYLYIELDYRILSPSGLFKC